MARPRKTQQSTQTPLHQTNGALPTTAPEAAKVVSSPQSVYDLLGWKTHGYRHETLADYQQYLDTMNLAELQRHSVVVANIIPIDDRRRLIDRLEKEFCRVNAKFAPQQNQQIILPQQNKENIERILRRGM